MSRRIFALFTVLILILSMPGVSFAAQTKTQVPETVTIRSAGDFVTFAENCTLDSWSEGRNIELIADIDMSMVHYVPAAIFKGTFEGNGHTISGLTFNSSGSVIGLFRYNDGEIRNLVVDVSFTGTDGTKQVGGIAGLNRGYIENCVVFGNIKAESMIGGIAGENAGEINECYFGGSLSSDHYAGGIAGKNNGVILNSVNSGKINTELTDSSITDLDEFWDKNISSDLSSLISPEELSIVTDAGGIAGASWGKIISCTNNGSIGYQQVGYNVGGIAGRSLGSITDCDNRGTVLGRQDVGGIVGQAQPFVRADMSLIDELRRELNGLYSKVDIMLEDANQSSDEVSSRIQEVFGNVDAAIDSGYDLADNLTKYINRNTEEINDLAIRIDTAEKLLDPAVTDFSKASRSLNLGMNYLNAALNELIISDEMSAAEKSTLRTAIKDIGTQNNRLGDSLDFISWVFKADANDRNHRHYNSTGPDEGYIILYESRPQNWRETNYSDYYKSNTEENLLATNPSAIYTTAEIEQIEDDLMEKLDTGSERRQAMLQAGVESADAAGKITNSLGDVISIINKYYFTEDENGMTRAERMGEDFTDMTAQLENASFHFSNGMRKMEDFSAYISSNDPLQLTKLGTAYRTSLDNLKEDLQSISGSLSETELALNEALDLLLTDMQGVNGQFNRVMMVITDILDYLSHPITEETFTDESETVRKNQTATSKVTGSNNRGNISGESNVGGIAGSMSFETDFNPVSDVQSAISIGVATNFFTHCIAESCNNYAVIEAKSENAGGIIGLADSGVILNCNSYSDVHCTDGSYCGGIAGNSKSIIRNCYSKGNLSALSYLGGIAGLGETITDCGSIVQLSEATECVGSIAGNITGKGDVLHNVFANSSVGGIDGVSYKESALPLAYDEMMSQKNIPSDLSRYSLKFIADGDLIKTIDFQYGDSLSEKDLPKVPEKFGYIGSWEEYDFNDLSFSDSIEAVYTPLTTVIESEDIDEYSNKAIVLAEGSFEPFARIRLLESDIPAPEKMTVLYQYCISMEGAISRPGVIKIHTLVPEDGKHSVYVYVDGSWKPASGRKSGSYLVFTASGNTFDYCVVKGKWLTPLAMYGSLGIVGVGALTAFLAKRLKKRKQSED